MKKLLHIIWALPVVCFLAASCQEESLDPESIITVDAMEQNDFDRWLEANYVHPYNIQFKYRYETNESDLNYWTIPADMDCAIIMAHLVKYLCVDTYDEVAGTLFTRKYFPKMFYLIGEWEYNSIGTFILGTAEGGKKILLSGINYIPYVLAGQYRGYTDPKESLNTHYIKTIHHEFTHILNQTKDFPVAFTQISTTGYVADLWSSDEYTNCLPRGFITRYSQHSDREDFAEMMSMYVTHTQAWWDSQIAAAGDGAADISAKLDIVKSYMQETFGIDLDLLRETVLRRQDEVLSGKVDLTSLEIDQ